jgi:hypothetical protein
MMAGPFVLFNGVDAAGNDGLWVTNGTPAGAMSPNNLRAPVGWFGWSVMWELRISSERVGQALPSPFPPAGQR